MASVATISSMVGMVTAELQLVVEPISAMAHLPPSTVTQINTAMDGLQAAATALAHAETTSEVQALLPRFATDANAVLEIAAAQPLPPRAVAAMRVAQMAVPLVMGIATAVIAQIRA